MSDPVEEIAAKVAASLSVQMVTHLEFETQLPQHMKPRIIGVFQPYWRGDITLSQLMEALRLIGYSADLDVDGLYQFVSKEDMH